MATTNKFKNVAATEFVLNEFTRGFAQCIDNNWNYSIFAQDPNADIFQQEYNAGYVQGKIQGGFAIRAARNNTWNNFTIAATPQDNINIDITPEMLSTAQQALIDNYNWLCEYCDQHQTDAKTKMIQRLMFRQLGIFEGAADRSPRAAVTTDDLTLKAIGSDQQVLHTGTDPLTFLDIYFINAQYDLFYAIGDKLGMVLGVPAENPQKKGLVRESTNDHCSGFVKFMPDGEMYITHNSWMCYYNNSCAVSYTIGEDFVTQNAVSQGQFGSNTDFGFNRHGIGFNETTHVNFFNKPKTLGIWIVWRSAAAEQFASSIEEFYEYLSMDNTATYLNGYMVVDAYRHQFGLVEMSYNRFVLFTSDGKTLKVEDSTGHVVDDKSDYDSHLISPTHIIGVNQPIDWQVNYELAAMNERPMRRNQLYNRMHTVQDMESAKDLITYTEDREPLSVYGRWDVGYGTTEFIHVRPDGSADAKAFGTKEIRDVLDNLSFKPSLTGGATSFWMKYGTPYIMQKPFVWSESLFAQFKSPESEDNVPDTVDGQWNLVKLFME